MTNEELQKHLLNRHEFNSPTLECVDGFKISVQASRHHYCTPRSDVGPYTTVECGYPTESVPEWNNYARGSDHTDTVFGQVPVELVLKVLNNHGGLKGESQ